MADGFESDEFGSDNPYLRLLNEQPAPRPRTSTGGLHVLPPRSTLAQDTLGAAKPNDNPYLKLLDQGPGTPPSAGSGGIGSYISAALAPQDVAFRYGARHLFGIPVSDEATAASALTSGLGLQQGDEGYGKRVLRSGIEFGADVGLNPLTYALPGGASVARGATAKAALEAGSRLAPEALGALAPEAATAAAKLASQGAIARRVSQAAGVGFTGMMGAGLAQKVPQIAQDIGAHGFTPEVAGELTSAGLEAAGAGFGAAHLYHGFKTPYGVPEPAPRIEVPLEGPVQEGAIPRVTTISLEEAARVNSLRRLHLNQLVRERGMSESDTAGTQYSPSWVDEPSDTIPVPGFDRPMRRARNLSPAEQEVSDRATQQVLDDPAGNVAAYRKANTKNGTLTINTDNARELFPDYNASPENRSLYSAAVHEPSNWVVRRAWEEALAEPTPEGKRPHVIFTSGPTGVGKSTGLKIWPDADKAHIIFDTNMNTFDSAVEKIEQAKAAGKGATILYTHRDPVVAWFKGVLYRAMRPDYGRMVPLDSHMATSNGAPEVSRALRERYANDPNVSFKFVDNTGGPLDAKLVDPSIIDGVQYDWSKVREEIEQGTRAGVEAGEYPPRILQGAGIVPVHEQRGILAEDGGVVRGEPAPEPVEGQPGAAPAAPVSAEGVEPAPQPAAPAAIPFRQTPQPPESAAVQAVGGGGNAVPESAAAVPYYAVAPRKPEPPSPLGFYSQLERVASSIPQPMKGSDMARYLADPKRGVKAEEMKWTGLDDWLKERAGAKVTPQEVQDFVRANSVEVKEVTLGKRLQDDEAPGQMDRRGAPTKFGQWQLPGGENYREVLLTLPDQTRREGIDVNAPGSAQAMIGRERAAGTFTGGHFPEPNVLAHVRLNDRTDADGKRVLFVEEVQSDWAQKGRREGFKVTDADVSRAVTSGEPPPGYSKPRLEDQNGKPVTETRDGMWTVRMPGGERVAASNTEKGAINSAWNEYRARVQQAPPAAPFVTSTTDWSSLAMKRIMRMAAEEGYDRVAWTTGEQQAARYDLSKTIDRVTYKDGKLIAYSKTDPGTDLIHETVPPEKLADYIGKDAADKLLAARPDKLGFKEIGVADLKVGGEGMKGFYDQILPQVVEKIGKKWGVKVGATELNTAAKSTKKNQARLEGALGDAGLRNNIINNIIGHWDEGGRAEAIRLAPDAVAHYEATLGKVADPVHSIDITPEMRASVAGEGFPQFKAAEQGAPAASLKTRDVQAAFGKAPVRQVMGGWQVGLGGDREVFIHPTGEIEYNPAAFKAGYNREMAASERVVGEYRRQGGTLGRDGVIFLAKDAPEGTVHHEAFHAAMDLVLSDKEKAAVLGKYGNEEAAAEAYAKWTPAQTNSWFSKILAFFTRVYRSFKPTWESAFEETRSGRAFGREEPVRAPVGVAVPFAPAPPADFNRAKSTSSRPGFLSEYSDDDLAGKQTFLSPDKRTGYLLDENGDFGNLFNTGPKGAGREAILHAIEKGDAQTLDAFDGYLPKLYAQYGFKPTGAMKWNDQYAPKGWNYARDGRPDVVFMSYQGGDRGTIRDRVGTFEPYNHPGNYYDSFDQAKADSRAATLDRGVGPGTGPGLGGQEPAGAGEPVGVHRQPVGVLDVLAAAQRGQSSLPRYATAPAEPPRSPGQPTTTDRLKEAVLGEGGRTSAKPGAGGEREGPINLDRINTTDDVKQMMDRLVTANLPDIRRGKGKMTLAEIKAAGEEILGKGQLDERKLEKAQRENSALNSAQMTAARMLHQSAIDRVMEAGKAHAEALKDPHADPTRTEDALNATVLKWKGVGLAALGRQAEAARTLAAHNIFVEGLNPEQRMLHDAMKQNGMAMSDADIKDLVLAAASGDRKAVENAARKALAPSWFDKFYELYINGMISGPATHIANNASNTGMQAAGVVKRLLSAGIEQVRAKVQGQTPERFVDDTYAHLRGLKRGLASAFEPDSPYSFTTAMKGGASGGKLEINRLGAIPGKLGEVVRLPGTALEAEDKVFKSASFFSEAYVRAGRKARGEATNRGMADTAAEEYISKRREEIVDAIDKSFRESTKAGKSYSGPFKDIFEPAEKAARYDTFQKEAGPILAAVMRLREADPTGIFKIVMPFMRTPANIAKVTIEHTPLKLFEIAKKIRNGELKGGQISDELAKPLFGALLAIPVVYAAKEGMLTGSGPTDPRERELWRATGAQPNSVVLPIDGKLTYISYGRLEPISTLMTMAVDFNEAASGKTRGAAADKIVGTVLNSLNDKTFLAGLSDLVLAWHDPKRYASTLVKDTAGNLVPASSLMRATAHAIDPVTRERIGVLDAMMANIPGLSQRLPAKPTGTGVPIERQHPIISSLTPFSTTEERPENRIERLMLDLDFHPSTPQRILTIPGSHGRKVELTREEFAAFERADRETTIKLQGLVDRLKRLPSEEQRAYLERAYSDAARRVRERLYGTSSFRERARAALTQAKAERTQSAGAP